MTDSQFRNTMVRYDPGMGMDEICDALNNGLYVGFLSAGAGAVARTVQSKLRDVAVGALDIGLVPNDNTKRAANTAALEAALAVGTSTYVIEFPHGADTWYFESFTFPQKPVALVGHASLRNDSGTILDFDPTGTEAISAPVISPQTSRFGRIEGLIINTGLTKTAIYVNNGGLLLNRVWVKACGIGLYVKEAYGMQVRDFGASAAIAGMRVGGTGNTVSISTFENIVVNNYVAALPITSGIGIWLDGDATNVTTGNRFVNIDCSYCFDGVVVEGNSTHNTWEGLWMEQNYNQDVRYDAVGSKYDTWINKFTGTPAVVLTPDDYGSNVMRIFGSDAFMGSISLENFITFPNPPVPSAAATVLDCYLEESWTPVVNRGGGGWAGTYTKSGSAIKIGRLCFLSGKISISAITTASSGINIIQGVPTFLPSSTEAGGVVTVKTALTTAAYAIRVDGSNGWLSIVDAAGNEINENWLAGALEFNATWMTAS